MRMRKSIVAILLLVVALSASAQEFNTHWIYAPQSDSLSHIWFRRAYISNGRPRQALITVASTGNFKLYINECNIGTAAFFPSRHNGDTSPAAITFNATPYLRRDTNVVAIVYSPEQPSLNRKQISVCLYGISRDGKKFSHTSDNSWICRLANSQMTADGGEIVDGLAHDPTWKAATCTSAALWLNAKTFYGNKAQSMTISQNGYNAWKIKKVTSLNNLHITQNPVLLPLAKNYWGYIRLTLREAKRGEKIQIGKLTYICNGKMDEQAYPLFTINSFNTLSVSGDNKFSPAHIIGADIIEMSETWFNDF